MTGNVVSVGEEMESGVLSALTCTSVEWPRNVLMQTPAIENLPVLNFPFQQI